MIKRGGHAAAIWVLTVLGSSLVPAVSYAETAGVTDPEQWYAESYGPLWHEHSADKLGEILTHYHSEIWFHSPEGEPELKQAKKWITEAMKEWAAEDWTGSEVPDIRTDRINDSTASFTTRWLDHYSSRDDEYSCAWYLADRIDGSWKFTHFAPIDCDAHGF